MATLYWSPVTSKNWNVVGNWWTDAGCTAAAANVPWVSGDATYLAYDLAWGVISGGVWDATAQTLTPSPSQAFTVNALNGLKVLINGVVYTVSSNTATVITMSASGSVASGTYNWSIQSVTANTTILATAAGSCSLTVTNSDTIYGGTFTGASFTNNSHIYGGTFTGASFTNSGFIYGGTFTGASFTNSSHIYGGTFTGASFTNSSGIYGGTFTGASFTNSDTIYGGTFTGASFTNSNTIYGGTFTGASFTNSSGIYGGTFTGASFTNSNTIYGGFWWLAGRMKMGATTYTASGDASPSANFTNFYTDNCQLTAAKIVAGNSVTELGTTVNGGLALADILNANTGVAAGGTASPGGTIIIPI